MIIATQTISTVHLDAGHFDVLFDCCHSLLRSLFALRNTKAERENVRKEVATESATKLSAGFVQVFLPGRCMSSSERHLEAGLIDLASVHSLIAGRRGEGVPRTPSIAGRRDREIRTMSLDVYAACMLVCHLQLYSMHTLANRNRRLCPKSFISFSKIDRQLRYVRTCESDLLCGSEEPTCNCFEDLLPRIVIFQAVLYFLPDPFRFTYSEVPPAPT